MFTLHHYFLCSSSRFIRMSLEEKKISFQLQLENYWMESLDYRHFPIHINGSSAILNKDKTLTINVSHYPINIKNNLISEGRNNGAMLLRLIGASDHPIPKVEIKNIDSMGTS